MNTKKLLCNNSLSIGTWVTIPNSSIIEILATAGFEWVAIDIEHSAISIENVRELIATARYNNLDALVRVGANDSLIIKHVLDAGASGVIIPLIKNRDDIKQAVNSVYYPPIGQRGVGLSRAQNYGVGFDEYIEWLNENVIVIAQIEHKDGVENLEEIINVNGVDGIIIGPYDLSASLGKPGDFNDKLFRDNLSEVEVVCKNSNFPLGVHIINPNPKEFHKKYNSGYRFIAYSIDFLLLGEKVRHDIKYIRGSL